MFTSYEPSQMPGHIAKHLDPTEKVVIARRFHWAMLLQPVALIVTGVFVTIAADLALNSPGARSHEIAWVLWALWLLWTASTVWDLRKASSLWSGNGSNRALVLLVAGALVYGGSKLVASKRFGPGGLLLVALLVVTVWCVFQLAHWFDRYFVLTNKRIVVIEGLISTSVRSMPVPKLTDMAYRRTAMGRALGYGLFDIESAGQDQALKIMNFVPDPENTNLQISHLLFGSSPASPKNIVLGGQVNPNTGHVSVTGQMDG